MTKLPRVSSAAKTPQDVAPSQPGTRGYWARRARRIRRAFARQAREQATPISGVITPGRSVSTLTFWRE